MTEQPADLRDQVYAAIDRDDFSPTTMADAAWAVIEPKLNDLTERLAEMTRLRDNALREAAHANQSVDVDLEGILNDGLHGRDWDGDDHPPEDLIRAIVGIVRPVVAHAVKRAETAEATVDRVRQLHSRALPTPNCADPGCDYCGDNWPCSTIAALDRSDLPAVREFAARHDPRAEGS